MVDEVIQIDVVSRLAVAGARRIRRSLSLIDAEARRAQASIAGLGDATPLRGLTRATRAAGQASGQAGIALGGLSEAGQRAGRSVSGTAGALTNLRRAGGQASGALSTLAGSALGPLGVSAVGLTGGIVALGATLGRTVFVAGSFEQALAEVRAVTGATGEDFDALSGLARQLGAETQFSAVEAAEGFAFLGRAGFNTNQILAASGPILDLAAAGQLGLAETSNFASNILSSFNLSASETNRVADVMAEVTASANTNVQQLASALSFVAPDAARAGISIEETSAAIGVLGNQGLQATRAGTGLRGVIASLAAPSGPAVQALADLGLSLDDVNVESRGLLPVLQSLNDSNIDSEQRFRLFGREASSAAAILIRAAGASGEAGSEIEELTLALEDSQGAARRQAGIINDTLFGAFRVLSSALDELFLSFNETIGLTGGLETQVRAFAEVIRSAAADLADFFLRPRELFGQQLSLWGYITGAVSTFIGNIRNAVNFFVTGFNLINAVFTRVFGSFGEESDSFFGSLVGGIINISRSIVEFVTRTFGALARALSGFFPSLEAEITEFSNATSSLVTGASGYDLLNAAQENTIQGAERLNEIQDRRAATAKRLAEAEANAGMITASNATTDDEAGDAAEALAARKAELAAATERGVQAFAEESRELQNQIDQTRILIAAQGQGTAAIAAAERQVDRLNQAQGLSVDLSAAQRTGILDLGDALREDIALKERLESLGAIDIDIATDLEDLQLQRELIGATAEERDRENRLLELRRTLGRDGVVNIEAEIDARRGAIDEIVRQQSELRALDRLQTEAQEAAAQLRENNAAGLAANDNEGAARLNRDQFAQEFGDAGGDQIGRLQELEQRRLDVLDQFRGQQGISEQTFLEARAQVEREFAEQRIDLQREFLERSREVELEFGDPIERLMARQEIERELLEQRRTEELDNEADYQRRLLDQETRFAGQTIAALEGVATQRLALSRVTGDADLAIYEGAFTSILGSLSQFGGSFFRAAQALSIANAVINTAEGVTQALKLPFPINLVQAAVIGAAGAAQVATIASQSPPQARASGGMIYGPGGPRDDRVPALLSAGEFVINAEATKHHLPLLAAINNGKVPRSSLPGERMRFQAGGLVPVGGGGEAGATNNINVGDINITATGRDDAEEIANAVEIAREDQTDAFIDALRGNPSVARAAGRRKR